MNKNLWAWTVLLIVMLAVNCWAQNPVQQSSALKEKLTRLQKSKSAITITIKSGGHYYFSPSGRPDREIVTDTKTKFSGTLLSVGEEDFTLHVRAFLWQYFDIKARYEEVEKIHVNVIPNGMKATGEVILYCILLMPTGACAP